MPQNTETSTYNAVGALKLKQFKKGGTVLDSHVWAQLNYETNFLVKWLTHLFFGFGERGSSFGSGAKIPR